MRQCEISRYFLSENAKYLPAESVGQNKQESLTESKHGARHGACQSVRSNNNPPSPDLTPPATTTDTEDTLQTSLQQQHRISQPLVYLLSQVQLSGQFN